MKLATTLILLLLSGSALGSHPAVLITNSNAKEFGFEIITRERGRLLTFEVTGPLTLRGSACFPDSIGSTVSDENQKIIMSQSSPIENKNLRPSTSGFVVKKRSTLEISFSYICPNDNYGRVFTIRSIADF